MSALLDVGNTTLGPELFTALQAISVLLLVGALAWYLRRLLPSARASRPGAHLQIEERVALDLRNALVIVRVEQRRLLLATSEQGPARLLMELASDGGAHPPSPDAGEHG